MNFKFKINNKHWEIIELENEDFIATRNDYKLEEHSKPDDGNFVFGFCVYRYHKIYLNKAQCIDEKKSTLIHELTHAWLWTCGASYTQYEEEAVCDTISASYDTIHSIIEEYFVK